MKKFDELYAIATRKSQYDQTNTWFKGVETYLEAIGKEVDEVREEIREDRLCHLEDELGDVLWNYLNVLKALAREKGIDPEKANLSFVCSDLSDLSKYAKAISTPQYRFIKNHIPGPFTFILPSSREVPKILKSRKDTIGLRIPDHRITHALAAELGHPILSSSLPGEMVEEYTDPELIHDNFEKLVDLVIDGGIGGMQYSTIVDMTEEEPVVIRQGIGQLQ